MRRCLGAATSTAQNECLVFTLQQAAHLTAQLVSHVEQRREIRCVSGTLQPGRDTAGRRGEYLGDGGGAEGHGAYFDGKHALQWRSGRISPGWIKLACIRRQTARDAAAYFAGTGEIVDRRLLAFAGYRHCLDWRQHLPEREAVLRCIGHDSRPQRLRELWHRRTMLEVPRAYWEAGG